MSGALLRYDEACRAIAEVRRVDEALDLRSKADAVRAYARQAKNRELECDAAEIRFRAERRLGEILVAEKAAGRFSRGQPPKNSAEGEEFSRSTLEEAGVDHKLSSRAQKLAAIPRGRFEGMLGEWRDRIAEENQRVTVSLIKEGEKADIRASHAAMTIAGCTVRDLYDLIARKQRFGAIAADPAWHYHTRSERGMDRSAGQHYGTQSLDDISALPIAELADDNSILFLWAMDWDADLAMARAIIAAWGFVHKTTAFTWVKLNPSGEGFHMGQGHWTRSNPEICLLATRGSPKRLHADVRQLIVTPVMEHSRKPEEAYAGIERLVGGPYLELNARRQRPGWTCWGNEIPHDELVLPDSSAEQLAGDDAIDIPRFLDTGRAA
jgi:N6-adenosine-specific RNA methylase IME4